MLQIERDVKVLSIRSKGETRVLLIKVSQYKELQKIIIMENITVHIISLLFVLIGLIGIYIDHRNNEVKITIRLVSSLLCIAFGLIYEISIVYQSGFLDALALVFFILVFIQSFFNK